MLSSAQPLSVGATSDGEYLDMTVNSMSSVKDIMDGLNSVMNEGIKIVAIAELDEREEKIKKREEDLHRREEEYQELIILGRRVKAEQLSDGITKKKPDHDSTVRRLPNINY